MKAGGLGYNSDAQWELHCEPIRQRRRELRILGDIPDDCIADQRKS